MYKVLPRVGPLASRGIARTQYAIRDVQALDQTSEIAVRCETKEGQEERNDRHEEIVEKASF